MVPPKMPPNGAIQHVSPHSLHNVHISPHSPRFSTFLYILSSTGHYKHSTERTFCYHFPVIGKKQNDGKD